MELWNWSWQTNQVVLKNIKVVAQQNSQPAGSVTLTGNYAYSGLTSIKLGLDSVNQRFLEPVLNPFIAPRKLGSGSVTGTGTIQMGRKRIPLVANGCNSYQPDIYRPWNHKPSRSTLCRIGL